MRSVVLASVLVFVAAVLLMTAGCGNVCLKGEALTAAETSAMDAYGAVERAAKDQATPQWQQAYLTENFKQWRHFVRSARKDLAWGPKLAGESGE